MAAAWTECKKFYQPNFRIHWAAEIVKKKQASVETSLLSGETEYLLDRLGLLNPFTSSKDKKYW